MLGGACLTAEQLGLPPAMGALAAGVAFSGTRLSTQIDSILLPFRETFAAVFFVTLGALLQPAVFLDEPVLMTLGLVGMIAGERRRGDDCAAARRAELAERRGHGHWAWRSSASSRSCCCSKGCSGGVISEQNYNRTLFIALGTLIVDAAAAAIRHAVSAERRAAATGGRAGPNGDGERPRADRRRRADRPRRGGVSSRRAAGACR